MFDQLSLVWQVWGLMLLGAVVLMAGLFVGIEWPWICSSARVARLRVTQALLRLFTAAGDDPYPQTPETIARAHATQRDDRERYHVDEDGHTRRLHGLTEIQRSVARPALVPPPDDALRRRQLLSATESSPFRTVVH